MLQPHLSVFRHLVCSRISFDYDNDALTQRVRRLTAIVSPKVGTGVFGPVHKLLSEYDSRQLGPTGSRIARLAAIRQAILHVFPANRGTPLAFPVDIPHKNVTARPRDAIARIKRLLYHAILCALADQVMLTRGTKVLTAAELNHTAVYSLFLCYMAESDRAVIDTTHGPMSSTYRDGLKMDNKAVLRRDEIAFLASEAVKEAMSGRGREDKPQSPTLTALMGRLENDGGTHVNVWGAVDRYVSGTPAGLGAGLLMTALLFSSKTRGTLSGNGSWNQ